MIRWIKKKLRKTKVVTNNYTDNSFQVVEPSISGSHRFNSQSSSEGNSLEDQQSVGEEGINCSESQIPSNDEEIRRLKRQLDVREKEFANLRIAIQYACTVLSNAVTTADDALEFKDGSPCPSVMNCGGNCFREQDLIGAEQSVPIVELLVSP
ncbi:hypothetical protein POPTR_012G124788v4 [Populus trichocarpa]|uniref:Uncharacterized protein n=1 Tax=Populus trichocarpa TaxID=3694 RepID=A0A3N7FUH3_POPTR|nr:uncharacterized protein LOC18109991 isoform X8 [Populus trichocarpa]RQO98653.2 hypothetical protein POPTR_012G124788v4 [Populus trichocarpa]